MISLILNQANANPRAMPVPALFFINSLTRSRSILEVDARQETTMKTTTGCVVRAALLAACVWAPVHAQVAAQKPDMGKSEFESNCAACHGVTGKGNGPITDLLKKSPPDLTQLAKKNGGALPVARLYEVIDGAAVAGHGTREMPVWGREYRVKAAEHYGDVPYDPEVFVRGRILALVDYINRLQEK